jgi:hypothetical protein
MARTRFNPAERANLAHAGLVVEFLDGSHWKLGQVMTGEIVTTDLGWQHLVVQYIGPSTRTMSTGATIWATPRRVRIPA